MMQMRDWVIGFIGLLFLLFGGLPMLGIFSALNDISPSVLKWILLLGCFLLGYAGFVEITNSNIMGKFTVGIAFILFLIALLQILHGFGIGFAWFELKWLNSTLYSIIFIIQGFLLLIATAAMEL